MHFYTHTTRLRIIANYRIICKHKHMPHTKCKARVALPRPRCVLMLMYRAVPVKLLCSRYAMCLFVSESMYSFARPKSMMCIMLCRLFECRPIKKFSGFTSRNIKRLECTYSIRRIWQQCMQQQIRNQLYQWFKCHCRKLNIITIKHKKAGGGWALWLLCGTARSNLKNVLTCWLLMQLIP